MKNNYVSNFSRSFPFLCMQVLNISLRLFEVAVLGWNEMKYFSKRHNRQVLVTGLKILPLDKIFQSTL